MLKPEEGDGVREATIRLQRPPRLPRRFVLVRMVDDSGVSGVGVVAAGCQFEDGTVVLRWMGDRASTVVWANIEDAVAVHGHGGHTRISWIDDDHRPPR